MRPGGVRECGEEEEEEEEKGGEVRGGGEGVDAARAHSALFRSTRARSAANANPVPVPPLPPRAVSR